MALHPSLDHADVLPANLAPDGVVRRKQQLHALTSLRFVAAALIVIGHAHPVFGSLGIATAAPLNQGVSFFFVLSGFILAYNYPTFDRAKDFQRFFVARFARLWPLHVFTCLLWMGVVGRFETARIFPAGTDVARLVANLLLVQSWVPSRSWILAFNGVSWSISVECFFYLAFPFLVRSWSRHWHRWLAVEGLIVAASVIAYGHAATTGGEPTLTDASTWTYFSPLVRLLEFTVGVGVARLLKGRPRPRCTTAQFLVVEVGVIAVTLFGLVGAASLQGISAVFGPVAADYVQTEGLWPVWALLIATFAISDGPIARVLSWRPFVFLGEASFALYLVHVIVLTRLEPYAAVVQAHEKGAGIALWAGLLLLSTLLLVGVERPARQFVLRRWAKRHDDRLSADRFPFGVRELAAVVALLAIAIGLTVRPPTMIVPIDDASARAFLAQTTMKVTGSYPNGLRVLGLRLEPGTGDMTGSVLLQSARPMKLDSTIAIHVNDETGTIIAHPGDFALDGAAATIAGGVSWIQSFRVAKADIDRAATVGIVIYRPPSDFLAVSDAPADWDGKRLLFKLH